METAIRQLVWSRANSRCEYCHLPQAHSFYAFEIDHIIAEKHGGLTVPDLALSCCYWNSYAKPTGSQSVGSKPSRSRHARQPYHGPPSPGSTSSGTSSSAYSRSPKTYTVSDWLRSQASCTTAGSLTSVMGERIVRTAFTRSEEEPLRAWANREVRIAFRIMTTNAHSRGYYCSPKWLFDAGCRSYDYTEGGSDPTSGGARIKRIEPDYGDPRFLEKHGQFIKALADRYDGNPQIEFIDIGSYGIWGEWHTKHPQPWAVRKQIIEMYLKGFQKTQLVSMSDDAEALAYALAHGTGFRRDGVGSPWHEARGITSRAVKVRMDVFMVRRYLRSVG